MASDGGKMGGAEGMSQNRGFLFSENHFCHFRGMASDGAKWVQNGLKHVPKTGFLVFGKKVLPKKGHKTADFAQKLQKWAESCPKIGVSYFKKKGFAEKGTC